MGVIKVLPPHPDSLSLTESPHLRAQLPHSAARVIVLSECSSVCQALLKYSHWGRARLPASVCVSVHHHDVREALQCDLHVPQSVSKVKVSLVVVVSRQQLVVSEG